uniref:Uncharacterized protein n=1 Tax=Oryza meyeriana var. granulata TaxID=110450 RepID=C0JAF6_9ORYZ|nr:unknown [Oryza meyeriana var. granulata]
MGSRTELNQDNIMGADYGEFPEANHQTFEAHIEDIRRKMASCYRKAGQGVIKQEKFTLSIVNKSKELVSREDQQPQLLLHHRQQPHLQDQQEETEQQRNQWAVLRLYEAINSRDHATAHALLAPDHHMMHLLTGGAAPSSFRFRPLSVDALRASDVVVVEGVTTTSASAAAGYCYWVHAWTVGPHGVITHLPEYFNTDLTVTRLLAAPTAATRYLWQSRRPDRATNALPGLVLAPVPRGGGATPRSGRGSARESVAPPWYRGLATRGRSVPRFGSTALARAPTPWRRLGDALPRRGACIILKFFSLRIYI